ncbi:MAG: nitroreductase family protein [Aigarchaeota archaeon]|nr:nitroreductase family protein [Candidatus Pelearchaeum maunauluense]
MVCEAEAAVDFLKSRRSSKLLKRGDVPLEHVKKAIEAATYAANAHNSQPWRFIIITSEEIKEKLLEAMEEEWRRDLSKDGLESEKIEKIIEHASERTRRAAILVIACLTMEDMDVYPDERRQRYEYIMGVQSVAAAVQNMLLALHAYGLGACWRCSPLFAQEAVRRVLGIPEEVEPQALIEIGLPGGQREASRKPLGEVCFLNTWGGKI